MEVSGGGAKRCPSLAEQSDRPSSISAFDSNALMHASSIKSNLRRTPERASTFPVLIALLLFVLFVL